MHTLSGGTVVDEALSRAELDRVRLDYEKALAEARDLATGLKGFDVTLAGDAPLLIVRLPGFVIYIIVYQPRALIVASEARRVLESLKEAFESIRKAKIKPVAIFYSRKGVLGPLAYLYLGRAAEDMGIGVLFINGGVDEILEVLWSLENKGEYRAEEEDYVPVAV